MLRTKEKLVFDVVDFVYLYENVALSCLQFGRRRS